MYIEIEPWTCHSQTTAHGGVAPGRAEYKERNRLVASGRSNARSAETCRYLLAAGHVRHPPGPEIMGPSPGQDADRGWSPTPGGGRRATRTVGRLDNPPAGQYHLDMAASTLTGAVWILIALVALLIVVFIIRRMIRLLLFALLLGGLLIGWLLIRHGGLKGITQTPWWPW